MKRVHWLLLSLAVVAAAGLAARRIWVRAFPEEPLRRAGGTGESPASVPGDPAAARLPAAGNAGASDPADALKKRLPEELVGVWMDCAEEPDQGCANHYLFAGDHGVIREYNGVKTSGEGDDEWDYVLEKAERGAWKLDDFGLTLTFTEVDDKGARKTLRPPEVRRFAFADMARIGDGTSCLQLESTFCRMDRDPEPADRSAWEKLSRRLDERFPRSSPPPGSPEETSARQRPVP